MREKQRKISVIVVIIGFLLLILLCIGYFHIQEDAIDRVSVKKYEKEYVLITEENDSEFWQSVYESGQKEAEKNNAYLEQMGSSQPSSYTMTDCIKIAIASEVDGILLHPDGTMKVQEQIKAATNAGIPVVTLVDDAADSERISCIGLNAYQLGQLYADAVLRLITPDTNKIEILLDDKDTTRNDMIFNQITSTIRSILGKDRKLEISSRNISRENTFDSEEAVRDIIIDFDHLPDILVCFSDVDTQAACQAVVDYNQVGNVSIIGYYTSDTILHAIDKNIAYSTITLDTEQIGKEAIDALEEYQQSGYVSEYISINLDIVTKDNIMLYLGDDDAKNSK